MGPPREHLLALTRPGSRRNGSPTRQRPRGPGVPQLLELSAGACHVHGRVPAQTAGSAPPGEGRDRLARRAGASRPSWKTPGQDEEQAQMLSLLLLDGSGSGARADRAPADGSSRPQRERDRGPSRLALGQGKQAPRPVFGDEQDSGHPAPAGRDLPSFSHRYAEAPFVTLFVRKQQRNRASAGRHVAALTSERAWQLAAASRCLWADPQVRRRRQRPRADCCSSPVLAGGTDSA